MNRALVAAFALTALLPLSGCFGSSDGFDFVPGTKFKPTGNTVHLKATVVDYDAELFEGLNTWLWAFCFAPMNANDAYSANAIEGWNLLENDKAVDSAGNPLDESVVGKCSVPGPTLRVKQGDRVIVEFSHQHFHPHTIHWHGQFVEWDHDGAPGVAQDSVQSGGAYKYDFIAKRAGTLWYHCHVDTQLHVQQGLYGMMIIEPQDKTYEPKGVDEEYVIILSTMNRNTVEAVGTSRHSHPAGCASGFPDYNGVPCENPSSLAGQPDIYLLNGHSFPYTMEQEQNDAGRGSLITMKEGDRIRLRILNAGETIETLHPHGHDMLVIGKDGNPFAKSARYYADTLTIGPAERYDVVIDANNPGPWMMHTHTASHETNCMKSPGGMHTMMVYEGWEDKMHQFKAESPVDCPAGETLVLPGDYHNSTSLSASTVGLPIPGNPVPQDPAQAEWQFPVELPCGVRSLEFYVHVWQPTAAANANPASVVVTLTPPTGSKVGSTTLPAATMQSPQSFIAKEHSLGNLTEVAGSYLVDVKATGTDVKIDLDVHLDYYESFEQSKIGHLKYKVGGCPGYT